MEVLTLTIFVSLVLVVAAGLAFAWNIRERSHEQADRLVLLPLADDLPVAPADDATVQAAPPSSPSRGPSAAAAPSSRGPSAAVASASKELE